MADGDYALDAEQDSSAVLVAAEGVFGPAEDRLEGSGCCGEGGICLCGAHDGAHEELGHALEALENRVAREAVGHDDVEGTCKQVVALGIAGELRHGLLQTGMALLGKHGALRLLGAIVEQRHARLVDIQDNARIGKAHLRKLNEVLGLAVGVGTQIEEDRGPGAGQHGSKRGTVNTLDAADAQHRRSHDGTCGAGGEEAVGHTLAHELAPDNDAGVGLGTHCLHGMLFHGNDLRCGTGLAALMGLSEGDDLVTGAGENNFKVLIGLKGERDALEHTAHGTVATSGVDAHTGKRCILHVFCAHVPSFV